MVFLELYVLIALALVIWFGSTPILAMDKYDRRQIRWGESLGILLLSAALWPVVLLRAPASLLRPARLYEMDSYKAKQERERDRLKRELGQCPNRIRYISSQSGRVVGEFYFQSNEIAAYLARRTANDGYGSTVGDIEEINSWVKNCDPNNDQIADIPWVWQSAELLIAELVESGLGCCLCSTCGSEYQCSRLHIGTGNGSPGWIAVIATCPEGHDVMKFDLLKPFCSHRRVNDTLENTQINNETLVPHFLKK